MAPESVQATISMLKYLRVYRIDCHSIFKQVPTTYRLVEMLTLLAYSPWSRVQFRRWCAGGLSIPFRNQFLEVQPGQLPPPHRRQGTGALARFLRDPSQATTSGNQIGPHVCATKHPTCRATRRKDDQTQPGADKSWCHAHSGESVVVRRWSSSAIHSTPRRTCRAFGRAFIRPDPAPSVHHLLAVTKKPRKDATSQSPMRRKQLSRHEYDLLRKSDLGRARKGYHTGGVSEFHSRGSIYFFIHTLGLLAVTGVRH